MGASVDFEDENLRRLVVNAAHHLLGVEVPAKADVTYVDEFKPTFFSFIREKGYFEKRNLKPTDFALGKSASDCLPEEAAKEVVKRDDASHARRSNHP